MIDPCYYARTTILTKLMKKGANIYLRNKPLQPYVILTKKDCSITADIQQKANTKYGSIHFRSVMGASPLTAHPSHKAPF